MMIQLPAISLKLFLPALKNAPARFESTSLFTSKIFRNQGNDTIVVSSQLSPVSRGGHSSVRIRTGIWTEIGVLYPGNAVVQKPLNVARVVNAEAAVM